MTRFDYQLDEGTARRVGLIVLQSDETIEREFRKAVPEGFDLLISRVPSGLDVTPDTLQQMEAHLPRAAGLFPQTCRFDAVGYGCTSGTAQIGAARIAELVTSEARTPHVTEPVSALIGACATLGLTRLAFLSPYVADVSKSLRDTLARAGIETPVFGSFEEAQEARVARISGASIRDAARTLAAKDGVQALFMSCTNLQTFPLIDALEAEIGMPVLSSNQVLAWHLLRLAGEAGPLPGIPGQLSTRGLAGNTEL